MALQTQGSIRHALTMRRADAKSNDPTASVMVDRDEPRSPQETSEAPGLISNKKVRLSDGQTLTSLSCVIIGSTVLAAVLAGYLKGDEVTPILITVSGSLFVISIWWAQTKHYQEAWVFGSMAGFDATYALLQLGVTNRWYGIPIQDLANVLSIYIVTWIFLFAILAYAVLRESKAMSAMLLAVIASLAIVLAANLVDSLAVLRWGALPLLVVICLSTYSMVQIVRGWNNRGLSTREGALIDRDMRFPQSVAMINDGVSQLRTDRRSRTSSTPLPRHHILASIRRARADGKHNVARSA